MKINFESLSKILASLKCSLHVFIVERGNGSDILLFLLVFGFELS